jgi:tetratricopeptide (TPR) repeat protein
MSRLPTGTASPLAASFHQRGNLAQDNGDYNQARDWYRKSLNVSETLGDRAAMALSYGQLGALYTLAREAEAAVPFSLGALGINLELRLPEVNDNLTWLNLQRDVLGPERFQELLTEHHDEENAAHVLKMMDDFAAGQAKPA